ncbi:tetratricopeptide repeat protein [bacterium]|nr:MAG: tetratricopeptide repeat protein [bacterium]
MNIHLKILRYKKFIQLLSLVILCFLIYAPSLGNGFIWDDDTNLYKNPWIQTTGGLKDIWLSNKIYQYYPVNFTSFWLEHKLWGLNPSGYHAVNLILHILNVLLVFWVVRKLYARLAFPVALLFAVHPIQVETVAWITERKNLLSLFFFLSAILAYLRFDFTRRIRDYLFTVAMFAFALLSKPVAVCFIFFPALYKWWRDGKVTRREFRLSVILAAIGLFIALHTLYLEFYQVGARGSDFGLSFLERFILSARIMLFYPYKIIFPFDFVFFYPRWEVNANLWWQWLFSLAVILIAGALFIYRKKIGRGALALLIFYMISIFPVLGFLNVYGMKFSYVADHFSYLSTPALLLLICAGITFLSDRLKTKLTFLSSMAYKILIRGIFIIIIIYMCGKSIGLTKNYKNEKALWSNLVKDSPRCLVAYDSLAEEYRNIGEKEKVLDLYKKAVVINPAAQEAYYNLGNAYCDLGRNEDAIKAYERAIEINPGYLQALNNLASTYADLGQTARAIEIWNKAVQIDPGFAIAHFNLVKFYFAQKKYNLAIKHCDEIKKLGIQVDPKFLKLLESHVK